VDPTELNESERALVDGRRRGVVDEQLLAVVRREPLVCGVEEVDGRRQPAAREVGGAVAVLAWTSVDRAVRGGWPGELVEQRGQEVAALLAGTAVGLAINAGDDPGVGLDPGQVARLAQAEVVPAGTSVYLGEPEVRAEAFEARLAAGLSGVAAVSEARVVLMATGSGSPPPQPTVVLTLTKNAPADARESAYSACDRAARASGMPYLGVVVDDDLHGLKATALALPAAYRRSAG